MDKINEETKYSVYAIKDTLMGFSQIYLLPNNAAAIRWFGDYITNKDNPMSKHPDNFQLFKLGTMGEQSGLLEPDLQFLENATTFFQK